MFQSGRVYKLRQTKVPVFKSKIPIDFNIKPDSIP